MGITRRRALVTAGAASIASCTPAALARDPHREGVLSGAALYADVSRYAGMGHHRTGSPADLATLDWIESALRQMGARVQRCDYPTANFFLEDTQLLIDESAYIAFPLWHPMATGGNTRSTLVSGEATGAWRGRVPVFVLEGLSGLRAMRRLPAQLEATGAEGAVLITRTAPGSFYADNSGQQCALPILITGSSEETAIVQAARTGVAVELGIAGVRRETTSSVILGEFGPETGPAIYVSTPLSAFTQAAGERGCGIALFLALARSAAQNTRRRVVFLAESGHEIDSPGLRAFMDEKAPERSAVSAWLHIGANIATYEFEGGGGKLDRKNRHQSGLRTLTNQTGLQNLAASALAGSPFEPDLSTRSYGTTGFYMGFDYPVIGFEGGSAHHHTPDDDLRVTDPALLEETAQWMHSLFVAL